MQPCSRVSWNKHLFSGNTDPPDLLNEDWGNKSRLSLLCCVENLDLKTWMETWLYFVTTTMFSEFHMHSVLKGLKGVDKSSKCPPQPGNSNSRDPTNVTSNLAVKSCLDYWPQLNAFLLPLIITNMGVAFILFRRYRSILQVNKTIILVDRELYKQLPVFKKKERTGFHLACLQGFAVPLLTVAPRWTCPARWSWQTSRQKWAQEVEEQH